MSSAGFISGMMSSFKNNRMLLLRNRQRKRRAFEQLQDTTESGAKPLVFKQMTAQERKKYMSDQHREIRFERKMRIVLIVLFCTLLVIFIYFLLKLMGV